MSADLVSTCTGRPSVRAISSTPGCDFVLLSCCFAGDVAVVEVATKTVVEFGPFWI